jgi:hypothetical protein
MAPHPKQAKPDVAFIASADYTRSRCRRPFGILRYLAVFSRPGLVVRSPDVHGGRYARILVEGGDPENDVCLFRPLSDQLGAADSAEMTELARRRLETAQQTCARRPAKVFTQHSRCCCVRTGVSLLARPAMAVRDR